MDFNKSKILQTVREQLAIDMNCSPEDFLKEGVIFSEASENDGRRRFDRQTPYLEAATMGKSIVVSGDIEMLNKVRPLLENRTREDIFDAPFFFGHSLYYIPDFKQIREMPCTHGITFHVKEGKEIFELYKIKGFENAIQYDERHQRPDVLVIYAMEGNEIVAMAGASEDSKTMWQIGIDVIPQFRGRGIAAALVSKLALMILERGIVPYYGAASSNVASQATAHRSGFIPAWMCTYRNIFDGSAPFEEVIKVKI